MTPDALRREVESRQVTLFFEMFSGRCPRNFARGERPDFLLSDNGRTIGVEHTRVFKTVEGLPLRAIQGAREQLLEHARRYAESSGTPPLYVDALFDVSHDMPRNRQSAGIQLAELCAKYAPQQREVARLPDPRAGMFRLPRYLRYLREIAIIGLPPDWAHRWTCDRAGEVVQDSRSLLQSVIDRKEGALAHYRKKCDECWLLIVAESDSNASFIKANSVARRHCYRSGFDRIFFLSFAPNDLVELLRAAPGRERGPICSKPHSRWLP